MKGFAKKSFSFTVINGGHNKVRGLEKIETLTRKGGRLFGTCKQMTEDQEFKKFNICK